MLPIRIHAELRPVANSVAVVLPNVLKELQQPPAAPHEIALLQPAGIPSTPASPKPKENLIIGLALGLVLGCGAALVVESLDRRLKDSADVEKASGLTALGIVPLWMPNEPVPTENYPRSTGPDRHRCGERCRRRWPRSPTRSGLRLVE